MKRTQNELRMKQKHESSIEIWTSNCTKIILIKHLDPFFNDSELHIHKLVLTLQNISHSYSNDIRPLEIFLNIWITGVIQQGQSRIHSCSNCLISPSTPLFFNFLSFFFVLIKEIEFQGTKLQRITKKAINKQ